MAARKVAIDAGDHRLLRDYGPLWLTSRQKQSDARLDLLRASRSVKVSQAHLDRLYEAFSKARAAQTAIERRIARSVTRIFFSGTRVR